MTSVPVPEELGQPFAFGREADVYSLGDGTVLRRYREGGDTEPEALIMRHVGSHGFPVPRVFAAGGADLVLERLDGPTMAALLLSGAMAMEDGAAILADLLRRLHALPPLGGNTQPMGAAASDSAQPTSTAADDSAQPTSTAADDCARPVGPVAGGSAQPVSPTAGDSARPVGGDVPSAGDGMWSLGEGGPSVLHLDLHPENVVITADGPVVIDWRNARNGEPDLDTAFTALILAQVATGAIQHPTHEQVGAMLDVFLRLAPGDPVRLLDQVVEMRSRQVTMSVGEVNMLPLAAARVRQGVGK
ncbi:hypothetical protein Aab01nite_16680 [Paractinoplanes abujensis]|uniref:tRNA A-37 threonylcarbamoyl transferase component Bud32 n=1 Tax=Paractinoplanes abujensis TaxID=882441 RepID=A0A7W7G5X9_9ACTN|nr:aminoglycoside phosphotransferase family protein [Actinoplanes abujensis]MBB4697447.1 tRNA A-37 threonylcarbamoyl transferase component Bud32 [Actinoplanes abujensis]GID18078.1 hypothetical protein Aab01nite_16680 [Actinoplanes abujensis]